MAAKLAKQAALEAKAATGDARFSDSPATGQDLRFTESSGDGPSFGKFLRASMPGARGSTSRREPKSGRFSTSLGVFA